MGRLLSSLYRAGATTVTQPCVSSVVDGLRSDGTLSRLEHEWLADAGSAPVLG